MIVVPRLLVILLLVGGAIFLFIQTRAAERLDLRLVEAIIAAQPLVLLAHGSIARRFQLAVSRPEARFSICLAGSLLGQAADLVLPWRLSEFVRVIYLRDRIGVPVSSGIAAAVIERSIDLAIVALLILVTVSLALIDHTGWGFAAIAAAALVILLLLPFVAGPLKRGVERLPLGWLRRFAERLIVELAGRMRDRVFWRALIPSAFAWLCALLATWLLLAMVDLSAAGNPVPVTLGLVLAVFVSTVIGAAAAILPAGVGTYEAGAVVALKAYGVALDQAIAVAVALHISQVLAGAAGGAVVAAVSPLRFRDLLARARAGMRRDPSSSDGGAG